MNTTVSQAFLALKPSKIISAIRRCLKADLVPIVRSSPGMGKSDIIRQIAKKARLKVIDFRLPQADITDLNGLPHFTEDHRAEYIPFIDFPLAGDPLPVDEEGNEYNGWLLFFDEINAAPKQIQAAAYKVLLERQIGRHNLHENVWMVSAGNLETDMAVTHGLSTALQSRLVHLELVIDNKDWSDWALENGIDSRIIAFLEFKPTLLHKFEPNHTDRTFACPRTWEFTSKLITGKEDINVEEDLPLLSGTLSYGVANEFIQFCQVYKTLPKLSDIEAAPKTVALPAEPSTRYALAMMLVDHFTTTNAGALMDFVQRLPVEARVLCLRVLAQRKPHLMRHPALAAAVGNLLRT